MVFDIGSMLASPDSKRILNLKQRVETFEVLIDQLTSEIPELSHFILPGGGRAGSQLHFCRTVCRRAERRIVELSQKEQVEASIIQYFNRLSDFLFVMARFANHKEKKKEIIWKNKT